MSLGLVLSFKRAAQKKFPIDLNFQITGWLLLVIPIGARLFHVLYEEPSYYAESPLRIFEVWKGGFVYYGGLIGALLFCLVFFKLKQRERNFWQSADFFTPILCFGTGFGRIACFIQGCCYGREWSGLWSIGQRHPTQLYITAWELLLFIFIYFFEKRKSTDGVLFLIWLGMSAFGRFVIEFYRDDFRGHNLGIFSVSQVIAIVIVVFCSGSLISRVNKLSAHRRSGT